MKKLITTIIVLVASTFIFTACSTGVNLNDSTKPEILMSDPMPAEIEARNQAQENVDQWNDEIEDESEYIENDVDRFVDTAKKEYNKNVKPKVDEIAESETWDDIKTGAGNIWGKTKDWTCKNFSEPIQEYVNSKNCKRSGE